MPTFLILNNCVFNAHFNYRANDRGTEYFIPMFSHREAVGINAIDLILGLSCLTLFRQQIPA
jgi:agmatine/peptidylarginine deiminase